MISSKLNIIYILLMIISFSYSKLVKNSFDMVKYNSKHFLFATKFSYDIGSGQIQITAKFQEPVVGAYHPDIVTLHLHAFLDDDWDAVLTRHTCDEKILLARHGLAIDIPTNGSVSRISSTILKQSRKTKVWYFAITDCKRILPQYTHSGNKIVYEIEMKNSDGSHFSSEESQIEEPLFIEIIIIIVFLVVNSYRFSRSQECLKLASIILNLSIIIEFAYITCEFIHLYLYSKDGIGSPLMDFLSQALQALSQFIITVLLILIATGWSIDYFKIEDTDLYIPLVFILGMLHALIISLGHMNDEEHTKFHDYEDIPGCIIIALRLIFFGLFHYFGNQTLNKKPDTEEEDREFKKIFLRRLLFWGSIYLLSFPVITIIASAVIEPYMRHKVVTIGSSAFQIISSSILAYMISAPNSKYVLIVMKDGSMLPSNKANQQ